MTLTRWITNLLLSLGVILTMTAATLPTSPLTVVTWNMSGGARNHGSTGGVVAAVLDLVTRYHPGVIALQEVCHSQHRAILAELGSTGYWATHTATMSRGSCHDSAGDNRFGNSLFIKGAPTDRQSYQLPYGENPPGSFARQPRSMVCATVDGIRVCTLHATPLNPDRRRQLDAAADILRPVATRQPVILTCDCNTATAPSYFPFLSAQSQPRSYSTTDSGKHLDWIFTNRPQHFVAIRGKKVSDHHILAIDVN